MLGADLSSQTTPRPFGHNHKERCLGTIQEEMAPGNNFIIERRCGSAHPRCQIFLCHRRGV